jgi:hypothetical protein
MFCDRCGRQLTGAERFCGSCGRTVYPVPPPLPRAVTGAGRIEGHVRSLGVCWLGYSVFRLLTGWVFTRFFTHWGLFWNPNFPLFFPGVMRGVGVMLMAGSILGIMAGWGLMERQPWARPLAIVLGFLALFHLPVGTVLGIYSLWVLLPAGSAQEYQRTARAM